MSGTTAVWQNGTLVEGVPTFPDATGITPENLTLPRGVNATTTGPIKILDGAVLTIPDGGLLEIK